MGGWGCEKPAGEWRLNKRHVGMNIVIEKQTNFSNQYL